MVLPLQIRDFAELERFVQSSGHCHSSWRFLFDLVFEFSVLQHVFGKWIRICFMCSLLHLFKLNYLLWKFFMGELKRNSLFFVVCILQVAKCSASHILKVYEQHEPQKRTYGRLAIKRNASVQTHFHASCCPNTNKIFLNTQNAPLSTCSRHWSTPKVFSFFKGVHFW